MISLLNRYLIAFGAELVVDYVQMVELIDYMIALVGIQRD
jgi:hypothetical protein